MIKIRKCVSSIASLSTVLMEDVETFSGSRFVPFSVFLSGFPVCSRISI